MSLNVVLVSPLARRTASSDAARERGVAALLDAAEDLVAAGTPFGELAVAEIATRAGFSRATFYAYFADKRALALALGERMAADLEEQVRDFFAGDDVDVRATLVAALGVFRRHRGTVAALVEGATYDEDVARFWRGVHEQFLVRAKDRLRRDGVAPKDAEARAFVLVWSTERSLTEHLAAPRVDGRRLLDALELMWRSALAGGR